MQANGKLNEVWRLHDCEPPSEKGSAENVLYAVINFFLFRKHVQYVYVKEMVECVF